MPWGRVFASCASVAAVAGCAVVVVGMSDAGHQTTAAHKKAPAPVITSRPAVLPGTADDASTLAATPAPMKSAASTAHRTASAPSPTTTAHPTLAPPVTTLVDTSAAPQVHHAARTTPHVVTPAAPRVAVPKPTRATRPTRAAVKAPAKPRGRALPLHFTTGHATRVITVVGRSAGGTTARLQAWNRVSSGHWLPYGKAVTAHIGADGMSRHASESRSATPIGSFTLTQAFGHNSNPGTHLPYIHTNANDWWISQPGKLYNTHQRCASGCHFTRGAPNEHLYYEMPYYRYAVNIDYNTRNAPGGVKQGRGSAFFLHVTDGAATAGCVAIAQSKLVTIMRWLRPSAHPRILIGVS